MTSISPAPTPADNRRATTLVCHYGTGNLEGVVVILDEAVKAKRVTPLIVAVLNLHQEIVPIVLTGDDMASVIGTINYLALDPDTDPEIARSAKFIIGHSNRDHEACNVVIKEAQAADAITELIVGILSVYRDVAPQLYSEVGLKVLQRSILDWAAREEAETA